MIQLFKIQDLDLAPWWTTAVFYDDTYVSIHLAQ